MRLCKRRLSVSDRDAACKVGSVGTDYSTMSLFLVDGNGSFLRFRIFLWKSGFIFTHSNANFIRFSSLYCASNGHLLKLTPLGACGTRVSGCTSVPHTYRRALHPSRHFQLRPVWSALPFAVDVTKGIDRASYSRLRGRTMGTFFHRDNS